jgi:hypothetical protein
MKKTLLSILGVATLAVGSAQSAVVFGNLGQDETGTLSDSSFNLTTARFAAIGFIVTINPGQWYDLQSVKLGLVGVGDVKLSLYTDLSGEPGGLVGSVFDTENVNNENVAVKVNFTLNQTLQANTPYWFVAERVGNGTTQWVAALDGSQPVAFTPVSPVQPNTPSGWAYLGALVSTDGGNNWSAPTGSNIPIVQALSISVTAIPEPSTWAAMAILAGGAAFAGWRRRRQQTVA